MTKCKGNNGLLQCKPSKILLFTVRCREVQEQYLCTHAERNNHISVQMNLYRKCSYNKAGYRLELKFKHSQGYSMASNMEIN